MTRTKSAEIDSAVLDALWRRPLTISELTVELHRRDAIPPWYTVQNVAPRVRKMHAQGVCSRLGLPSATRSVLWWTHHDGIAR